ncbi:MAG: 30S ribosomal protein S9 [Candidatus Moranbacteria bacterium]|jgi:small subunit ribosomal protein S9|nr:30S ribosomal protein S9 [Candidatus Moranbacteria bacterium]
MAIKDQKQEEKATEKVVKEKKVDAKADKYFYAVGRRKAAVAQVRIYMKDKAGDSDLIVNEKKMRDYFTLASLQNIFLAPLKSSGFQNKVKISVLVRGGGNNSQAEATRLGIARALVVFDEDLKKTLKAEGFLTRDSRKVERKKPGLKKARRSPQWAKR